MEYDLSKKVTTKYKVNKKKGTVICIITTVDEIPRRLEKYDLADEQYDDFIDVRVYKGIAYCAPEDEWNEAFGRRLAEYRAQRARQVDVNTEIKKYIKGLSRNIDNLYDYGLIKEPRRPEF